MDSHIFLFNSTKKCFLVQIRRGSWLQGHDEGPFFTESDEGPFSKALFMASLNFKQLDIKELFDWLKVNF
jgi:hypothetical protein